MTEIYIATAEPYRYAEEYIGVGATRDQALTNLRRFLRRNAPDFLDREIRDALKSNAALEDWCGVTITGPISSAGVYEAHGGKVRTTR